MPRRDVVLALVIRAREENDFEDITDAHAREGRAVERGRPAAPLVS
jgi:hypothetical protein